MNGLGLQNTLLYLHTVYSSLDQMRLHFRGRLYQRCTLTRETARQSALTTTARFIIQPQFVNAQGVRLVDQMRRIGKANAMQDRRTRRAAANLQPGNAQAALPAPLIACGWANFKWAKAHGSVPTKSLARQLAVQGATVVMMSEKGTTEADSTCLSRLEEYTALGVALPNPNLGSPTTSGCMSGDAPNIRRSGCSIPTPCWRPSPSPPLHTPRQRPSEPRDAPPPHVHMPYQPNPLSRTSQAYSCTDSAKAAPPALSCTSPRKVIMLLTMDVFCYLC
ncbi:hypothetical protein DFS34DRAFT_396600 [Phlyctochytrium arcticum]|nr:hypothetical protein DFS34DRAFT_396600 [Phlyctochytrium arcticum]